MHHCHPRTLYSTLLGGYGTREYRSYNAAISSEDVEWALQMMHPGWELERAVWEDQTRASRSVQEIGNAMAYLEDWIALDYAPGSDVRSFLCLCVCTSSAWSACCALTGGCHVLYPCACAPSPSAELRAVPFVERLLLSCEHLFRPHAFADGGHRYLEQESTLCVRPG